MKDGGAKAGVNFIQNSNDGARVCIQLFKNNHGGFCLELCCRMAAIDEVEQNVGVYSLFQSRLECSNKRMRNFTDKTYRVNQEHFLPIGKHKFTGRCIKCCKEFIFDEHFGVGEGIEKG